MTADVPYANRKPESPLRGGITMSHLKQLTAGFELGTLGFFVTLDGETAPHNIGLVTCNHVLAGAGATKGDCVYQPQYLRSDNRRLPWKEDGSMPAGSLPVVADYGFDQLHDLVGYIFKLPDKKDYKDKNNSLGFYVDAAVAKLNIEFSSCCHSSTGVGFPEKGNIVGLDKPAPIVKPKQPTPIVKPNAITGFRALSKNDINTSVFKVGRNTGLTMGLIKAIDEPFWAWLPDANNKLVLTEVHNTIKIEAVWMPDNLDLPVRFSERGDSGAALIDEKGNLVGLLFAGNDPKTPNVSYACHIMPVLNALKATAITSANPVKDNGAASSMLADVPTLIDGRPKMSAQLRARFRASGVGQRIGALVEQHRHEVLDLVNHNRRVTVVWHRSQGPAFLNRCIANARDPETRIPREIEGVTLKDLLRNMAKSLADNGSAALRAALERHLDEVLAYASDLGSLHELMDHLAGEQPK